MFNRSIRRLTSGIAGGALAPIVVAPAMAHVSSTTGEGAANSTIATAFRVGHGCEGLPTTSVSVQIPNGVTRVTPQWMEGWDLATELGPVEPYDNHGETVTEDVKVITWSGGNLPDGAYLDFGVRMRLPDAAGETLQFPVVQSCEVGEIAWTQTPDPANPDAELERPAATIDVTEATGDDGHDGATEEVATEGETGTDEGSGEQAASDDSDNTDSTARTISWVALGVGVLGIVVGGGSFLRRR